MTLLTPEKSRQIQTFRCVIGELACYKNSKTNRLALLWLDTPDISPHDTPIDMPTALHAALDDYVAKRPLSNKTLAFLEEIVFANPAYTDFSKAVWREAMTIPFGETRSYGWIARGINRPKASRAVGAALGANPINLLIPCHRVIGQNQALTGYRGGLSIKEKLLAFEAP